MKEDLARKLGASIHSELVNDIQQLSDTMVEIRTKGYWTAGPLTLLYYIRRALTTRQQGQVWVKELDKRRKDIEGRQNLQS
jgi:hypothetical protein